MDTALAITPPPAPYRIGAHLSVSSGYASALDSIVAKGGNALQIFSTSPRIWKPAQIGYEAALAFRRRARDLGIEPVFFHASYLINLADDGRIGLASKQALIAELRLQPLMGVAGSVVHLGSYKDKSHAADGLFQHEKYETLIANIREILNNTPEDSRLIIENVATRKIGKTLEEIAQILLDVNSPRVQVCFDTCHLHAAGYDLSARDSFQHFYERVESLIGWHQVALFHLNDSRDPFGSLRDRHENLGEGFVPTEVFENILNHPRLRTIPMILETPGFDGKGPDARNIAIAKSHIHAPTADGSTNQTTTCRLEKPDKTTLLTVLAQLRHFAHTDKGCLKTIEAFIRSNEYLFRDGGSPEHHLCVFFVPVVPDQRLIYMGHHIKTNDWIPPGGHMEPGEHPETTIRREFEEELSYQLNAEQIKLFDASIKDVSRSGRVCKTHLDIWYLVVLQQPKPFIFQKTEFYDAAWMTYEEAVNRIQTPDFRPIIEKIRDMPANLLI